MGLFDRLKDVRRSVTEKRQTEPSALTTVSAYMFGGDDDLEVVGEASYQEALWTLCSGSKGDRIRHKIVAVLVPEPENPYDSNAISVHIEGNVVGYLARDVAAEYLPGLRQLMARCGGHVALEGVIVGGGYYDDGPGRLGVWLDHYPGDFGVEPSGTARRAVPPAHPAHVTGTMRTGFSEAWLTDVEDDSYDLSWFDKLPDADRQAIALLEGLLASDPDPIDRHFQFAELETRLYRCRDLYDSALVEFDDACWRHDAEMETIRQAFLAKWGKVPLLETYRQMAIRQQKQKNWNAVVWWTERGLALYDNDAAREDAVEDLLKRRNRALAKLQAAAKPNQRTTSHTKISTALAQGSHAPQPAPAGFAAEIEILICSRCETSFERTTVRGRKPLLCPDCRSTPGEP